MWLLAVDTCGESGGVAVSEEGPDGPSLRMWSRQLEGRTYSELLLTTVADVLADASVSLEQLAAIVVVNGPGSFTGIRIGVSAAKGLAEGLQIPVIALSRLELLARKHPGGSAIALLDAGRGEFYGGFYREGKCETEMLLTRDALDHAATNSGLPLIVCEQRLLVTLAASNPLHVVAPSAIEALKLAARRYDTGKFADISTLEANYLRRSEHEMFARVAEHMAGRGARTSVSAP